MSYYGKHVIHLANKGIVRIEGVNEDDPTADSNMSGKSAIIEAVLWCFFGKTLRGLKHESVVNRKSKKDCFVSTTFESSRVIYTCRRNRKHKKHSNKLLLFRKDSLISSRHESETQSRLEDILGCDFESFVNSVVFGGFDTGSRRQFALQTDSQQKRILDSFLKFEKFEIALERTKNAIARCEQDSVQLTTSFHTERQRTKQIRGSIERIEKNISSFGEEKKRKQIQIQRKIQEIPKTEEISSKRIEEEARISEAAISTLASEKERLFSYEKEIAIRERKLSNKKNLINKPCPTCTQIVKGSVLHSVVEHIQQELKNLRRLRKVSLVRRERLERRSLLLKRKTNLLTEQKRTHEAGVLRRKGLEEQLALLEKDSSRYLNQELEECYRLYTKHTSKVLSIEREKWKLQNRLADLRFWEIGFGNKGVKSLIIRDTLPAMNQKLKEYSNELFGNDVALEFKASKETKSGNDRELFNILYKTKKNANSYNAESSGGRRRVDICILLVFSWLSNLCNLLFVDELLDGLDASGREGVLDILSKQRGTVLVVSHNRELKSKINNVWTVRKRNGVSRLETSYG